MKLRGNCDEIVSHQHLCTHLLREFYDMLVIGGGGGFQIEFEFLQLYESGSKALRILLLFQTNRAYLNLWSIPLFEPHDAKSMIMT